MSNHIRIVSNMDSKLSLKQTNEDGKVSYTYANYGTKFKMTDMELVNELAKEHNGKVILIEPELEFK